MKMTMTARLQLVGLALASGFSLASGTPGRADGQQPSVPPPGLLQAGNAAETMPPLTPQQQAQRKAEQDQEAQLDNAAETALHIGNYAQAEADARQSLAVVDTDGIIATQLLAEALDAQGKDQEAFQVYKMMSDQGNFSSNVLLPYALLLLKAGQWTQALSAYNKVRPQLIAITTAGFGSPKVDVDFSPDTPQPVALAAAIHAALGLIYNSSQAWGDYPQDDKALAQYQQALALEPDWDVANFYYGRGLEKLGRSAQARAAFTQTLKIAHGSVKVAARKALAKIKPSA
jgi:tetratricopeptide (TPR) repeat protein